MFRSKAQVAAANRAARPHLDLAVIHDGKTWSFWSMGPYTHSVWLTDGRGFMLWDVKHRHCRPDITGVTLLADMPSHAGVMPVCDDDSQKNSPRKLLGMAA